MRKEGGGVPGGTGGQGSKDPVGLLCEKVETQLIIRERHVLEALKSRRIWHGKTQVHLSSLGSSQKRAYV